MTDKANFKLTRISTVMLGVKDLARAVGFYRDKLGLALKAQFPGFALLDGGNVTLCLSQPLARATPQTTGATEVVFSVDDVTRAYEALRGQGVQFLNEPRDVNGSDWAANFEDPDGHKLSIFGPKGGA